MRPLAWAALLVCALSGAAAAQGVGIPSSRWGLGFGNSPEFTGLRFNFRDENVRRVTGINVTLWQPYERNDSVVSGLSFGPVPGGAELYGLQLGLFGVASTRRCAGISIAGLGMGTGGALIGLNLAGIGMGAGKQLGGLNLAAVGMGSGEDLWGLSVTVIGVGAGRDVAGVTIAGIGIGAGRDLTGLTIAGLGLGAGGTITGLTLAGLAAGAPSIRGFTFAGGVVGSEHLSGVAIAGASVHVARDGDLTGLAISPFNYVLGVQTGVSIGIVNYAWRVRGVQLGLVNIVRDNPTPLRVLPVLNSSF